MTTVKLKKHSYNIIDAQLRDAKDFHKFIKFNSKHIKPGQMFYLTFDKKVEPINFLNELRDVKAFDIKLDGVLYTIGYVDGQTLVDYKTGRIGFLFKVKKIYSKSDRLIQMIKQN